MDKGRRFVTLASRSRIAAIGVAWLVASCAQILGVDDYSIAKTPPATNPCSGDFVMDAKAGGCTPVGVQLCGNALSFDAGACEPFLPSAPCVLGGKETLGQTQCASIDTELCQGQTVTPPGVPLVYVDRTKSATDSTGTQDHPYTTIGEALAHVHVPDHVGIVVNDGTYVEDLVIDQPGIQIYGHCAAKVTVTGTGAAAPPGYPCAYSGPKAAICISSKAAGSALVNLGVTAPAGDGIAIIGAAGITLGDVFVNNTARYGVRIEELGSPTFGGTPTPASASLSSISIRAAHGVGLYVAGATVTETNGLTVEGVLPLNGYLGYGVSILPGGYEPSNPTPTTVTLSAAVLIDNADAALHVAGSTVTVDGSFLGTLSSVAPKGRGVLVEREIPRGAPASVTITESTIEGTNDAGIDVRSAELTLDNVAVRNTTSLASDGSATGCAGQGIRVRSDPITRAAVTLTHSLVEGSRQAAIHALGAIVNVTDSILRGSSADGACGARLGDGVTLESLPGSRSAPSALTLNHSLIDRNGRAAIAAFGDSTVSGTNAVLSCSTRGLVDTATPGGARAGFLCGGCDKGWQACVVEPVSLAPWISAGAPSGDVSATTDWHYLVRDALVSGVLTKGVAWLLDSPEVAPGAADSSGCAPLLGVPSGASLRRVATWAEGEVPGLWQVPTGMAPTEPECNNPVVSTALLTNFAGTNFGEPIDFNRALVSVGVNPGVTGLPQQSPESGASWLSIAGILLRTNVDPGWTDFTVNGVACTGTTADQSGDIVPGQPSARRVLLEPGMINNPTFQEGCYPLGPCGAGEFEDATGKCLSGKAAQNKCASTFATSGSRYTTACRECECQRPNALEAWSQCAHEPACVAAEACFAQSGCFPSTSCATVTACQSFLNAPTPTSVQATLALGPSVLDECPMCASSDAGSP